MKILAIDSSGLVATVAVMEDEQLLAEYTMNYKKTHSQTLLPMLDEMAKMIELDLDTIDAIAVAAGPGSFTGLRIGSATAKGLGLALKKPLISVPTLEGMAYQFFGTDKLICPMMDARRNQVYTGAYEFVNEAAGDGSVNKCLHCVVEQCATDVTEWIRKINEIGREVIFLGDGVPVYAKQIAEGMTGKYSFAPAGFNYQRAASVAALGEVYFAQGRGIDAALHQPEYLRKSQAEREKDEKQTAQVKV